MLKLNIIIMTEMITEYSGRAIQETYTILVIIVGVLLSGHFRVGSVAMVLLHDSKG